MADSFAPTRALLRECLNYPGESQETLRAVLGVAYPSTIGEWLSGRTAPKQLSDWPEVHRKLTAHLQKLRRQPVDSSICDAGWRDRFRAYCAEQGKTPEMIAVECGVSEWHGHRWHEWGEIPIDRARGRAAARTGYDFDALTFIRTYAIAAQRFGRSIPTPLDRATTPEGLRAAIGVVRERSGLTIPALAKQTGLKESHLDDLGSRPVATRKLNRPSSIADVIVGLAQYVREHPEQFDTSAEGGAAAAIAQAQALIRDRPPRKGSTRDRTTVHWDRIAKVLDVGTHRSFQYRCPSGEFAIVVFVRFALAYERSALTTNALCVRTGFSSHRIGEWFNGRSLPDFAVLEALEQALAQFEGKRVRRSSRPAEAASAPLALESIPAARPVPSPAPPVEPAAIASAPVPTEGAGDILVGVASTLRGVRAMRRAGWEPDATARDHLITIARSAMDIGGLTPEDLKPKQLVAASDDGSPAVAAVREILPNLQSGARSSGGLKRRS